MVPLLGTAYGGDWEDEIELTELHLSEVLDNLARPPSLANDDEAYAIEIIGDSMFPRFKPGERAFVSPKAAVRPGDDVIVQLTDPRPRATSSGG
jgi:phage repressor protein C with HTH and peptisase S24 domain